MTDSQDLFTPSLHLLFSSPTAPAPEASLLVEHIADLIASIRSSDIRASWQYHDAQKSLGEIRFGKHIIQAGGLSAPLPSEVIDRTIHVSHWQPQIKAAMRQHRAHLNLVYQGQHHDPVEKMIALNRKGMTSLSGTNYPYWGAKLLWWKEEYPEKQHCLLVRV